MCGQLRLLWVVRPNLNAFLDPTLGGEVTPTGHGRRERKSSLALALTFCVACPSGAGSSGGAASKGGIQKTDWQWCGTSRASARAEPAKEDDALAMERNRIASIGYLPAISRDRRRNRAGAAPDARRDAVSYAPLACDGSSALSFPPMAASRNCCAVRWAEATGTALLFSSSQVTAA